MASKGSCKRIWLCGTQEPTDRCYRHYHNCYLSADHAGDCDNASGPGHSSADRVGYMVTNTTDAYRQMTARGWKS